MFLVFSVAAAAAGTTLASSLITEACAALLAAQSTPPSPPPAASSLSITTSALLHAGAFLVVAKVAGEQQAHATLQVAGGADDAVQVLCQATLSYTS